MEEKHFYCRYCRKTIVLERVVDNNICPSCACSLDLVNVTRSVLFNKLQGEFYEKTGIKPLAHKAKTKNEPATIVGQMEYVVFLETKIKELEAEIEKRNLQEGFE